jgi:transcriptional regulator with XRE-family HTH domain
MAKGSSVSGLTRRFAANLRRLRHRAGLTQDQLAAKAGVATRHLQKIEAGSVNVTVRTVAALAHALEVDASALFLRSDQSE